LAKKQSKRRTAAKSPAEPNRSEGKRTGNLEKKGQPQQLPAGITVPLLARAMWAVRTPQNAKLPPDQKKEAWKKDEKEYRGLARQVAARLKRTLANRAKTGAKKGGPAETGSDEV